MVVVVVCRDGYETERVMFVIRNVLRNAREYNDWNSSGGISNVGFISCFEPP